MCVLPFGLSVAKTLELGVVRDTEPECRGRRQTSRRVRVPAVRVGFVVSRAHVEHRARIASSRGKYRHAVERSARGYDTARAHETARGFDPDEVVERRRN